MEKEIKEELIDGDMSIDSNGIYTVFHSTKVYDEESDNYLADEELLGSLENSE